ncbi:peptidylprolyl isomerase [Phaeobacter sp. J2-8]|uniref:peptidylprolyl isomerase n=1 Tax=Phaeobacter sp. J2-8 TaxID=2931394 RepID=UPI001FD3C119|nr:peptidylprolyl isomerase [Phaeobacter sp. J2-8]MCJ7873681.1 SurA N-terminal domain-containing protein [Phaeobacter sp. J2-8]
MAKGKSISKTLVWILMGLLFVGLAGFGATNLSGTIRTVGSVGDHPISVDDYARALQQDINSFQAQTGQPLSFQQAQALGLPQQVLSRLITTAAFDNEAEDLGISAGDDTVARELMQITAFQGPGGAFDRETYRFALDNAGLNESEFEEDLRRETARALLQAAVVAGNKMPTTYTETLLGFVGETRDFSWAILDPSFLTEDLPTATDADLAAFHEENIAAYTLPESRDITYAWLTPAMLFDTVEIDEASLRSAYDEQTERFNQPERRLVERLVMPNSEAADAAIARITAGETTFEDEVTSRELALADVDMGDVTRGDLGDAADAIFAAEVDAVVGPLPSDFGPALYRINGILPAQETSFDDATPILREELAQDRARRVIEAQVTDIDDLLAGGATLEELAAETDMQLGQIDWTENSDTDIAGYDTFRDAAAAVADGDYPEVAELGDGGIFALRLNAVKPPQEQPLADVQDQVEQDWISAETETRLLARATELAAEIGEGKTFAAVGLTADQQTGQTRNGFLPGLPANTLTQVFALDAPGTLTLPFNGNAVVLRLDAIHAPDMTSAENATILDALASQVSNGISNDLFQALSQDIQSRVGINIDQQALNAVHANFQ